MMNRPAQLLALGNTHLQTLETWTGVLHLQGYYIYRMITFTGVLHLQGVLHVAVCTPLGNQPDVSYAKEYAHK